MPRPKAPPPTTTNSSSSSIILSSCLFYVLSPIMMLVMVFVSILVWDMSKVTPLLPCNLTLLGGVTESTAVIWTYECESWNNNTGGGGVMASSSHVMVNRKADRKLGGWETKTMDLAVTVQGGGIIRSVELTSLQPNTEYVVQFKSQMVEFKTFPAITDEPLELDFVFGSCSAVTVWPWNSLKVPFSYIVDVIRPRMLFLLGDNVYVDLTEDFGLGFYRIPFESAHRRVLGDASVRRALQTIPSYVMQDDHEVVNDIIAGHPLQEEGLRHYITYWSLRNPTRPRTSSTLWYTFDHGKLATFFVMDARTHATFERGRIMGAEQRLDFEAWLTRARKLKFTFIILCSPVSWSDDGHGWLFPLERDEIFDLVMMAKGKDDGQFLILSGDMHFAAFYRYRGGAITEMSASPFQGMPFMPDSAPIERAHEGVDRVFIHGMANYFGKVTLRGQDASVVFDVYTWPLLHGRHSRPQLLERIKWNATNVDRLVINGLER